MKNTFFTSDQHFGHRGIITHCNRPFQGTEDMDEEMVARWNSVVGHNDVVYQLGDFSWGGVAEVFEQFNRLNGKIHVIEGNHDRKWWGMTAYYSASGHKVVPVDAQYIYKFRRTDLPRAKTYYITLSHYAMRTWYKAHRNGWHLYGHSHGRLPSHGNSFDVGVDVWDFYPISLEQVVEHMLNLRAPLLEELEPDDD